MDYKLISQMVKKFAQQVSWQTGDYQHVLEQAGFFGPGGQMPEGKVADKIYECLDKAASPEQFQGFINAKILIGSKLAVKIIAEGHKLAPKVSELLNHVFANAMQSALLKAKAPEPEAIVTIPWLSKVGYQ